MLYGAAQKNHTLSKIGKTHNAHAHVLCGNCAARRATAAELAAVPAETTALCYPWLVKA